MRYLWSNISIVYLKEHSSGIFFFSSRRRHTRFDCDWSSDVCSSDLAAHLAGYSSSMIYSAAKAAVVHLTRCVAMELGESGVRVNSVSPGAIATGILAKALGMKDASKADAQADKIKVAYAGMQPIPRAGVPDDIAQCVAWLASDRASFVNGEDVVVDGGVIGGRMFTPQQEGLQKAKAMLGIAE